MVRYYSQNEEFIYSETYQNDVKISTTIVNRKLYDNLIWEKANMTGEEIFNANCTSCHNPFKDATGPKLMEVMKDRSDKWLRNWISNPSKMVYNRDSTAVAIFDEWNHVVMPAFPLQEKDMDKLISYLQSIK